MRVWLLALSVWMTACGSDRYALWGIVHGDISVGSGGDVDGVLVWEFFDSKWERARSSKHHRCGRVLGLTGTADQGCADCAVNVQLVVEDIEHDCSGGEGTHPSLTAMDSLRISPSRDVPAGSWPDTSWSWALGWGGGAPEVEGMAWDEGFEFGEPPTDESSLSGRRVRLIPVQTRGFSASDLSESTEQ